MQQLIIPSSPNPFLHVSHDGSRTCILCTYVYLHTIAADHALDFCHWSCGSAPTSTVPVAADHQACSPCIANIAGLLQQCSERLQHNIMIHQKMQSKPITSCLFFVSNCFHHCDSLLHHLAHKPLLLIPVNTDSSRP